MADALVPLATQAKQITRLLRANAVNDEKIAKRLRSVKDSVGEKRWLAWCQKHWGWRRSAAYQRLSVPQLEAHREANRKNQARLRADRSPLLVDEPAIEDASDPADPRKWQVREERIRSDMTVANEAREALRGTAQEIVSAGFRDLSKKAHPDTGGSEAAQKRLTSARAWLLRLIDSSEVIELMEGEDGA